MTQTISDTALYLLHHIVSDPDKVSLETVDNNGTLDLLISAPEEIVGQIIGKEGKIIKAIRSVLNLCYPTIKYNLTLKE